MKPIVFRQGVISSFFSSVSKQVDSVSDVPPGQHIRVHPQFHVKLFCLAPDGPERCAVLQVDESPDTTNPGFLVRGEDILSEVGM